MEEKQIQNINDLNQGIVQDLFAEKFEELLDNVADENTSPTTVREITIKLKVKPSEDRNYASTEIEVRNKLAPHKPSSGIVNLAFDGSKVSAYSNDPKQLELAESSKVIDGSDAFGRKVK